MSRVPQRVRLRVLLLVGSVVCLVLAGFVSFYASGSPDGLNRVAIDKGLDAKEAQHRLGSSPLAGYEVHGVKDGRLAGGLAGVAGVGLTAAAFAGIVLVLRRRQALDDRTR